MLEETKKQRNDDFLKVVEPYRDGNTVNLRRREIASKLGMSLAVVDRRMKANGLKVMPRGSYGISKKVSERREKIRKYVEKKGLDQCTQEDVIVHFNLAPEIVHNDLKEMGMRLPRRKTVVSEKDKKEQKQIEKMLDYYMTHEGEESIKTALEKFGLSQSRWTKWRKDYIDREDYLNFIEKNSSLSENNGMKKRVIDMLKNSKLSFREIANMEKCSFSYVCKVNQTMHLREGGFYQSRPR